MPYIVVNCVHINTESIKVCSRGHFVITSYVSIGTNESYMGGAQGFSEKKEVL